LFVLVGLGGRACVIGPDGLLFCSSNGHVDVRKIWVDKCQLQGIVSMPGGVFKPYAGVSSAILFFTKGGITDKVWFYDMKADGFSLDDKRQKIADNDIEKIKKEWKAFGEKAKKYKTGNSSVVLVDVEEIRNMKYDLSITRYKQVEYTAVEYEQPEAILEKLMAMEDEIGYLVKKINKELQN
jgi:type I restriction enzyme M protein